jgi:hypothetical protein
MHDETSMPEYDARERALFAALPREAPVDDLQEQRAVNALRAEGYFRRASRRPHWMLQSAAAVVIFAAGAALGVRFGADYAARNSIEAQIARDDLTLTERVFLLQRAGSAYVNAANGYADATAQVDSAAVEVARQILMGAATAVARRSMDGGVSSHLAVMFSGRTD